ncbi:EpsI family protein [Aquisphaera insulae]|uniref:EpsI family protein n=1 Tax=Aquisphaera insulae TaxID=2712864 RepID=UPI0013EA8AB2|nr:EpsI family protein [Aquisphaera insulae]
MTRVHRGILGAALLLSGLAAQAGLEGINRTERPDLRGHLSGLPLELGDWVGRDEAVPADIVERAQTTEYLNRVYESRTRPGMRLTLWINFSIKGTNLRHTPEICLPSGGWTKIESQTRVFEVPTPGGKELRLTRLGYSQGELVKQVGFWYYIFGEGKLENYVRQLPITSRSSHGQTTQGSSMTVEIFHAGDQDGDGEALKGFAGALIAALEPVLPEPRAEYYIP